MSKEPKSLLIGPFVQAVTMRALPLEGVIDDDALEVIPDAGILLRGGEILAVDSYASLKSAAHALWEPKGPCVALPGFVDSHTHLCWAGSRARDYALRLQGVSYQEIAAQGGGILDTMRQTREASQDQLQALTQERALSLMQRGVCTVEVKSGYGLSIESELKMLRAIALAAKNLPGRLIPTCLAAHIKPPEHSSPREYLAEIETALLPTLKAEGLAMRVDIFVEEGAFSVDEARDYLHRAKAMGFDLTLHSDQFSRGASLLAAEVGARSADHLEVSVEEDLIALRDGKVVATVLPGASLGLGIPFAPARAALDAGCCVAIASDWNPGSAPMGDLLTQAALLGAAQKLSIAETLAGITYRAAHALGLDDCARLCPGMRADLAIFPCSDFREIIYRQGGLSPVEVFCSGTPILNKFN